MNLVWPIDNIRSIPPLFPNPQTDIYISQGFGEHPEIYAQFNLQGHNGIDIAAPLDTPIKAVHDGKIEFYTDPVGYGNDIRLYFDEDGFTWDCVFGHLHKYEGQPRDVKAGDIIGYVDSTGFSTGNHLHFGIRKQLNGQVVDYANGFLGYIDPLPFFKLMSNAQFIKKAGTNEYGFYLPATTEESCKDKALNLGLDIFKSDNTVDFSKAKEITGL